MSLVATLAWLLLARGRTSTRERATAGLPEIIGCDLKRHAAAAAAMHLLDMCVCIFNLYFWMFSILRGRGCQRMSSILRHLHDIGSVME